MLGTHNTRSKSWHGSQHNVQCASKTNNFRHQPPPRSRTSKSTGPQDLETTRWETPWCQVLRPSPAAKTEVRLWKWRTPQKARASRLPQEGFYRRLAMAHHTKEHCNNIATNNSAASAEDFVSCLCSWFTRRGHVFAALSPLRSPSRFSLLCHPLFLIVSLSHLVASLPLQTDLHETQNRSKKNQRHSRQDNISPAIWAHVSECENELTA